MCSFISIGVITMTNKEIKDILSRLIDSLDYMDRMSKLPDCNDCGIANVCMYAPKIGEQVRINCPLHVKVK